MRIALLTDGIHPFIIGGMQKHSYQLIKYFAKNKIHVDVYHPEIGVDHALFYNLFEEEEVPFLDFVFVEQVNKFNFFGHYILESYLYSKKTYSKLKQNVSYDFIYAQGFCGWYFYKRKNKLNNVNIVIGVNFHGLNMFQPTVGVLNTIVNSLFQPFVRYNLRNANVVFSLGGKLTLINLKESNKSKDFVIESPIAVSKLLRKYNDTIEAKPVLSFLFIGRYDKIKGLEIINEAILKLNQENCKFKFNFIGPIPNSKKVLAENVFYYGEIKSEGVISSVLLENDILVCASISEGMPTVILEAMSAGLAIISTDVGAVDLLVDFENGLLIQPKSVGSLIEAMKKMINLTSDELGALKNASIKKIENNYLLETVMCKLIDDIKHFKMNG